MQSLNDYTSMIYKAAMGSGFKMPQFNPLLKEDNAPVIQQTNGQLPKAKEFSNKDFLFDLDFDPEPSEDTPQPIATHFEPNPKKRKFDEISKDVNYQDYQSSSPVKKKVLTEEI